MRRRAWLCASFAAAALQGCAVAPEATGYRFEDAPRGPPRFVDFAALEYADPLTREARARLTPESLDRLDQESLDRIYARLTAGSIPDGSYDGQVIQIAGAPGRKEAESLVMGYLRKMLKLKHESLEEVANALWEGKVFDRGEGILRNRIVSVDKLWELGLLQGNAPKPAREGDGYRLFPGKVFCGQSLLDSRRESIVIDYFFSDEIPGYRELPDFLAGRRGLQVRDELRMVRPGFYLGRAYVNKIYLLTFTLHNRTVDEGARAAFMGAGPEEECWTGTQMHHTSAPR